MTQPFSTGHTLPDHKAKETCQNLTAGLVSVIVPAYNAADTVDRTIYSIINQTYLDLEVLVVDDGSSDKTASLVQRMTEVDHRVRLLRKSNGGLVSARNHGIAHASGEFVAPLDADDIWHPTKIEKQVAVMRSRGDRVGLVYTWARRIDEHDRILFDITPSSLRGNIYAALIMRNFISSGTPLVRKCCVEEVGGYDSTLACRGATHVEDLKFYLDVAEHYDFDLVPEYLTGYRFRSDSMSNDLEAMIHSYELIAREARARHPELPDKLFRWALGHQHREFGLAYLSQGRLWAGAQLLAKALAEDPRATLFISARRVLSSFFRSTGLSERGRSQRKFLEVAPADSCNRPRMPWSRKRLDYITRLGVERTPTVPAAS